MKRILGILAGFLPLVVMAAEVSLMPYYANGWADRSDLPTHATLSVADSELAGVCDLFWRVDALLVAAKRREQAMRFWETLMEEEESPASDEALRFRLVWQGRRYLFDQWGRLVVDERFIRPDEAEWVVRLNRFYLRMLEASPYWAVADARPVKLPEPVAATLPVFAGFEADRYQRHDALILRLVAEFNENRAAWAGVDGDMTVNIPELSPALIKAQMIEESGGNGSRSREAWNKDPLQVNVPGDWSEAKAELGLKKPSARNEGSLEDNLRAGIKYLVRKGFGVSGRAVRHRKDAYFDSWRTALQRYNGRADALEDGRRFRVAYADRILRRAKHPKRFVPIAADHRP